MTLAKRYNMKRFIYILGIALVATSCTEEIDIELNDEDNQRLVVDGWITDQQKAHEVKLTLTTSYFHNEAAPTVSGANVTISDGINTYVLTEEDPGIYRTAPTVQGVPGRDYTLTIDYNSETYTAVTYMDDVTAIDSVTYELHEYDPGEFHYDLHLFTQEEPGVGDYYLWKLFVNGQSKTDTLSEVTFVEDQLVDGSYIYDWNFTYLDEDDLALGDTLYVEQHSLSEEANDAFIAIMLETDWRGGIFDSPPSNVPSNISNGALGFFNATAVSEFTTVIQ
jgi:hypothetical protein